jgi:hypothetical protein
MLILRMQREDITICHSLTRHNNEVGTHVAMHNMHTSITVFLTVVEISCTQYNQT